MKASTENIVYGVYIVSGDTKYNVTPALVEVNLSEDKKQLAQSASIRLMNVKVNGKWLSSIINVRDRVYIYANDGKTEEVFRGYVWTRAYRSATEERRLELKCYDDLIYLQESEDSLYFASGKTTKDIISTICKKWGVPISYSYESISHSKLVLRGYLADILTEDILDLVKDRTGKKYAIRSAKGELQILPVGSNTNVYNFKAGQNCVNTTTECTMEGMYTQVVILGKADSGERKPVEATVPGKTSEYGTLQKIIDRSENTSLADAKKEAQNILKEAGEPKWEYAIVAPNVPWIRKGDKVHVEAGDINSDLIVTGVSRDITLKSNKMTLSLEKA